MRRCVEARISSGRSQLSFTLALHATAVFRSQIRNDLHRQARLPAGTDGVLIARPRGSTAGSDPRAHSGVPAEAYVFLKLFSTSNIFFPRTSGY